MWGCGDEATLDVLINSILEQTGHREPPIDVVKIARQLGLQVVRDDSMQGRGRLVRLKLQATVCLRQEPRPERSAWSLAHEIGEFLMPRLVSVLGWDVETVTAEKREQLANRFASLLLVPTRFWQGDAEDCDGDLLELKARYSTASHEVLALRLADLETEALVTIFDQGKLVRRTRPRFGPRLSLTSAEKELWHVVHISGLPQKRRENGLRIAGWPIHEPQWKREILITKIPNEDEFDEPEPSRLEFV